MAIEGILRTGVEAQSSQTDAVKPLIFWESPHPLSVVRVELAVAGPARAGWSGSGAVPVRPLSADAHRSSAWRRTSPARCVRSVRVRGHADDAAGSPAG